MVHTPNTWGWGVSEKMTVSQGARGSHSHRRCFFLSVTGSLRFFETSRDPLEGVVI